MLQSVSQKDGWICVNFGIDSMAQKHHFADLYDNRDRINKDVGLDLRWDQMSVEKSSTQAIITK